MVDPLEAVQLVASSQVLADELRDAGRPDDALVVLEEGLPLCRELSRGGRLGRVHLADYLEQYSRHPREAGRADGALAAVREAVALLRRRGLRRRPPQDLADLGSALWGLTQDLTTAGRLDEAVAGAREAVAAWEAAVARGMPHIDPAVGVSYDNLALALGRVGRWEEALGASRRAVEVFASDGRGPDLTGSLEHLADALAALGREDEAAAARARAAALP